MTSESQVRATFNDTKNAQETLRTKLDTLERNNSIVKDKTGFFNLLADSLLGMEYGKECKLFLDDRSVLDVRNLGKFIRHLAYNESNMVDKTFFRNYNTVVRQDVPISLLWYVTKFEIFGVYPDALAMSIRISKEREKREMSPGASLEDV